MPHQFARELVAAAEQFIDKPAINHGRLSDCNFGDTTDRCLEIGLDRDGFDCSGFVIRSISNVLGQPTSDWSADLRHVRQMAPLGDNNIRKDIRIGDLLILGRTYTFDGVDQVVPGHVGIVTDMRDEDLSFIHASTTAGRVECDQLRFDNIDTAGKLLGVIDPTCFKHEGNDV